VIPFPSLAEVERIGALDDPLLRNLQITQAYHELSAALADRTGLRANWCTFATWASKQAGQTIRKEDLKRLLQNLLATSSEARQAAESLTGQSGAQAHIWAAVTPVSAFDQASDAVARGNKKVFDEIGLEFSRFLSTCAGDATYDPGNITRFCEALLPGDPLDGQRYLRQAFDRYYCCLFESDARTRLELLLLANLEIGFHEQTRLQPEIAESLEAAFTGPDPLARRLIALLFPTYGWTAASLAALRRLLGRPSLSELAIQTLVAVARLETRRLITEALMSIALPGGFRLRLGDDLRGGFPVSLQHIANPELQALLAHIDPTPDSPRGSGVQDWANLPDRLHFIADLFRFYAEAPGLFDPPFTPEQVTELKAGRRPAGEL
jgi:hypothetical protein